jgi:hypothetical protein
MSDDVIRGYIPIPPVGAVFAIHIRAGKLACIFKIFLRFTMAELCPEHGALLLDWLPIVSPRWGRLILDYGRSNRPRKPSAHVEIAL